MPLYRIQIERGRTGGWRSLATRLALGFVSVCALVVSAFLGVVIFLAVLGFVAVAALVAGVRLWLLKRQIEKTFAGAARKNNPETDYIDVEYREIDRKDEDGPG